MKEIILTLLISVMWLVFASDSTSYGFSNFDETTNNKGLDVSDYSNGVCSQNPIMVLIDVHSDPMHDGSLIQQKIIYDEWVDALNWALDVSEIFDAKITFLSTGQFMEWILEDFETGYPLIERLYQSGGTIGTHMHYKMRESVHHWVDIGSEPPQEMLLKSWEDHVSTVNTVITSVLGITDPEQIKEINYIVGAHIPDVNSPAQRIQMMVDFGFTVHEQGPNQVFFTYFKHYVMNPFRPSNEDFLIEDLSGPVVLVPTGSILGKYSEAHDILQDNRMKAKQARFLLELLNWLYDMHIENSQKVWTFGWGSHSNDYRKGRATHAKFGSMLSWLSKNFINKPVGGCNVAIFASHADARDLYYEWEKTHPGQSSFTYSASDTDWSLYPYLVPAATYLSEAWYEFSMPAVGTLRWHYLTASKCAGEHYTLYVLYTTDGVPETFDLSKWIEYRQIAVIDPHTGIADIVSPKAVHVPSIGAIIVPHDKVINFQ